VPALGVRYGPISGQLRFSGDSIVTEKLTVQGQHGGLTIAGGVRLEELTRPVLGLAISARDFDLINVNDYLKVRATGDVRLTGTPLHPVLTGIGRVSQSVVYFADLITKDIVNLEDPLNADLVDTLQLREQKLGASFQSRFLDSLSIRDLDFIIGDEVWLRSNEANFQLEGRLRVNKSRKVYRMDGSLDTPRGTYTLKAGGFINRTFTVERGTVRYFGDLNAELDVQARHVVKTPQGSSNDIPVIAHITGTLEVPKLELTSAPDRPPMSEPELISLLMLGTTDPAAGAQLGSRDQQVAAAGALALTGLSSELQRALTSDFNGILEIRPGIASSGLTNISSSATQVAIGRAITSKLFVTANAGFCFSNASTLSAKNLGASLEYRFRRELRLVLSAEPLQTCFATGTDAFLTNKRYQFGAELRWDRDY
jgi:autotransporter translocation and assembly factor TamB